MSQELENKSNWIDKLEREVHDDYTDEYTDVEKNRENIIKLETARNINASLSKWLNESVAETLKCKDALREKDSCISELRKSNLDLTHKVLDIHKKNETFRQSFWFMLYKLFNPNYED